MLSTLLSCLDFCGSPALSNALPLLNHGSPRSRASSAHLRERGLRGMQRCGPDVRELLHDGFPTVCVEDAPFAYVGVFTNHVNVGFFHGASLPDPAGLLEGTGKYMRHVKVKPGHDVDTPALEALITAAHRDIVARLASTE